MGGCANNNNDIIEIRINYQTGNYRNLINKNKTKKLKSQPETTYKNNNCKNNKKNKRSLKTFYLNDISGIMYISDNEENFSINENNTFKQIIQVF